MEVNKEEARLRAALHDKTYGGRHVPEHMHDAIINYVVHHRLPGRFLQAVLYNDLYRAVASADELNLANLHATVCFVANEAPPECHGTMLHVKEWTRNG